MLIGTPPEQYIVSWQRPVTLEVNVVSGVAKKYSPTAEFDQTSKIESMAHIARQLVAAGAAMRIRSAKPGETANALILIDADDGCLHELSVSRASRSEPLPCTPSGTAIPASFAEFRRRFAQMGTNDPDAVTHIRVLPWAVLAVSVRNFEITKAAAWVHYPYFNYLQERRGLPAGTVFVMPRLVHPSDHVAIDRLDPLLELSGRFAGEGLGTGRTTRNAHAQHTVAIVYRAILGLLGAVGSETDPEVALAFAGGQPTAPIDVLIANSMMPHISDCYKRHDAVSATVPAVLTWLARHVPSAGPAGASALAQLRLESRGTPSPPRLSASSPHCG